MLKYVTNNKLKSFGYLSLLFVIVTFFYGTFSFNKFNENRIHQKFQNVLNKKENTFLGISNSIFEISQNKNVHFFEDLDLNNLLKDNGIAVYLFKDDSLIYWSTNLIPVNNFFKDNNFDKPFNRFKNNWSEVIKTKTGKYTVVGLIIVKFDYVYENEHLINEFEHAFGADREIGLTLDKGEYPIQNYKNEYLFSLYFPDKITPSLSESLFLLALVILCFIFLIGFIYQAYKKINYFNRQPLLLIFGFSFDIIFIRFLSFYYQLPSNLYATKLFMPNIFASSFVLPSLGDFLLNSIAFLAISLIIFRHVHYSFFKRILNKQVKHLIAFLFIFVSFLLFNFIKYLFNGLVINSDISFNLSNISGINIYSFIGFLIFGLLLISLFLLVFRPLFTLVSNLKSKREFYFVLILSLLPLAAINYYFFNFSLILFLFFFIFLASFGFISRSFLSNFHFATLIFYLILFSLFTSYVIFEASDYKEKEDRKIIAMNLASERDYVAEFGFDEIAKKIETDTILSQLLDAYPFPNKQDYDQTVFYIVDTCFSDYWSKYEFLITICDSSRNLEMEEENSIINCADYFNETKSEFGRKTQSPQLTFLDFKLANDYYLGIINPKSNANLSIYFEIFSKHTPRGLGYPELLIDKKVLKATGLQNYSWARYEQNELVYHVGKYFYSTNLENYGKLIQTMGFFNRNKYNHLYFKSDNDTTYLISINKPGLLEILTPFSYIFIFYSLLLIFLLLLFNKPRFNQFSKLNFRKRLQITIVSLIVASFVFVGAGSLYYIISLNNDKNHTIISEKAQSVLIELEHKLAAKNTLTADMEPYLSEILYKFSLVFFSDLNLYNLDGSLLATSRPEVFDKGLIASKINPEAYSYMVGLKKSFYIHKEKIGNYEYYSAYVPFRNENNKLIAYLNLPYFAKQSELTNEISTFLVAFVNIYVIFIAIAVFIALLISNYITKPVLLIKEKIGKVRLGKTNEKIHWEKDDEIGSLVNEYNRMIDELSASASLLARSERESAWREMAKQIAHEIKNPLTPMKLSVQYLQKTWDEKAPDWDQRLKQFTQTIIEQIDSLSIIATEFSDFAKMPKSRFEKVELTTIINNSLGLFKRSSQVALHTNFQGKHFVRGDKEQLLRVFNNLIKNSIQAIPDAAMGIIKVSVKEENGNHILQFSDNGIGIPNERLEKVFTPNFTTKSSGMGLGLAMARNIIQNMGGTIHVESEEGKGTVFTISLPVYG